MDRTLRRFVAFITAALLTASVWGVTAAAPSAAQDGSDPADPAAIEEFVGLLAEELERTDALISALQHVRDQGYPAFLLPSGDIIDLTGDEVNILVAYTGTWGEEMQDPASPFRLAEMFARARDLGIGLELGSALRPGSASGLVTEEEFEVYWERLSRVYAQVEELERDHRERLIEGIDDLLATVEEMESVSDAGDGDASPDDSGQGPDVDQAAPPLISVDESGNPVTPIDLRADFALDIGPYEGVRCVFDATTLFRRDLESEYTVLAFQTSTFEDGGPDIGVNGAFPDPERYPNEPLRNLRKIEENVAEAVAAGARPLFRGSWPGFCTWATRTCPDVVPSICADDG